MRKLSLMDLAFFIAESENSPKHVAALMLCKKPKNAPANYTKHLLETARKSDRVAEPFNQVINFFGPLGPEWNTCKSIAFEDHVFYHHAGKTISWDEAREKAAKLHEPMLDRARPLWEFHVIDGIRGGKFALYFKLHHAYADGMTMTSWMDSGFSSSADDLEFTPPWTINAKKKRPARTRKPRPGKVLFGLAGLAKKQLRSAVGIAKISAQQTIERAGLTHDAVSLMFSTPRDTPLTGSARPARSVATAGVSMKRVYDLCDATCSTLNHVALACIDGAIHSYLEDQGMALTHPVSIQMPVNLRDGSGGQGGNRIGITLVDLAQPGLSPYRRLREIGYKLQNVKNQVAGIPAIAFEPVSYTHLTLPTTPY